MMETSERNHLRTALMVSLIVHGSFVFPMLGILVTRLNTDIENTVTAVRDESTHPTIITLRGGRSD